MRTFYFIKRIECNAQVTTPISKTGTPVYTPKLTFIQGKLSPSNNTVQLLLFGSSYKGSTPLLVHDGVRSKVKTMAN